MLLPGFPGRVQTAILARGVRGMDEAGVTGFYEVLLGSTRFYWVLRGSAGFYEVLPGSTRLCSDAARREAAERGDILLCPEADNLLRQVAASN